MMNTHEIAWAAGFFDGEGSTSLAAGEGKGGPFLRCAVPQAGENAPRILKRFKKAVHNLGRIYGPYPQEGRKDAYHWMVTNFEGAQAVIAMLWKYLSRQKREQAQEALLVMKNKKESPNMTPEARSARARHARQCQLAAKLP